MEGSKRVATLEEVEEEEESKGKEDTVVLLLGSIEEVVFGFPDRTLT